MHKFVSKAVLKTVLVIFIMSIICWGDFPGIQMLFSFLLLFIIGHFVQKIICTLLDQLRGKQFCEWAAGVFFSVLRRSR